LLGPIAGQLGHLPKVTGEEGDEAGVVRLRVEGKAAHLTV
jgi:hypothetical protein